MSIPNEVLLVTSGVGALQSAFFGVYLFTIKKGKSIANLLLAFLLLALAVRMLKSVSYYFTEGHSIPLLLMNFGFGANLAILPLLWLYLQAFLLKEYQFGWSLDLLHLLPSVSVMVLSPFLTSHFWMEMHGYSISLLLTGTYVPFCYGLIHKKFQILNRGRRIWILSVTLGVTLVWAGYTANFLLGIVPYIATPVIFSFVVYIISYFGLKQNNIFISEKKYVNSIYSDDDIENCFNRLKLFVESKRLFKDPTLILPILARQMCVSPNMLSETINKQAAKNFSDFINSYRVQEAQVLLLNPENSHKKIASIAYESGFNTLSAFNAAFKKCTSITPSEFRKKMNKQ